MFNVTLANRKTFAVDAQRSILDSARAQGIVLEHSCRTGRCGICKAPVVNGTTSILRAEESLTPEEQEAGIILTCCRTAASDISLAVEDLGRLTGVSTRTLPCRIASVQAVCDSIVRVMLRLPPGAGFTYLGGQYLDVIRGDVRRSYSIANALRPDGMIELHIRRFEDGVMSRYWFEAARENDLLRFEAPLGTFFFREVAAQNIVFLATGTGIAPVKAILEEMASDPALAAGKTISVYWGNRLATDFYWEPALPFEVTFVRVLSGADVAWPGQRGYVQDALSRDLPDLSNAVVYACGSDAMIKSARQLLQERGLRGDRYYSDAFLSSN
jgi:CDP-4-dehydro-6-deoxyglucose reductase